MLLLSVTAITEDINLVGSLTPQFSLDVSGFLCISLLLLCQYHLFVY